MTRTVRGITWDHPRGYDCLAANVDLFRETHPDIEVIWERRSLKQFGEQPIDVLAERYDLIVVDHPFVGHAAATGCLVDVRPIVGDGLIERTLGDSVGASARSYHWNGGVYGLPTDAAAQVASYRPDLLAGIRSEPPRTHDEVLTLAAKARGHGKTIATPACPTDAMCLVLTFAANLGSPLAEDAAEFLDGPALDGALGRVEELVAASHPRSVEWNPIQAYDAASAGDDIVYVSYAFGYSNYARSGRPRPLAFTDVAGPGRDPVAGALLGGAGCAVTRSARDLEAIAAYLRFVHDPAHQQGPYFDTGGQPGLRSAWTDDRTNRASGNFFRGTLQTLDKSYLRPRFDGFVPFFEEGGAIVNRRLRGAIGRGPAMRELRSLYARSRAALAA